MIHKGKIMDLKVLNFKPQEIYAHQDIELYYVLNGTMQVQLERETFKLYTEDIIIVNANTKHSVISDEQALVIVFTISYSQLNEVTKNPFIKFNCNSVQENKGSYEELRRILKRTISFNMYSGCLERIKEYQSYYEIIHYLVHNFSSWNGIETENSGKSGEKPLLAIIEYIQLNYDKQIGLQDLSDKLHLSVPYLSKYIRRELGIGFVDYINQIRLYHAMDDLMNTSHSVTQIAYDNGFPNLTSFNRFFKRTYQMTPSTYKLKMTQRAEIKQEKEQDENYILQLRQYFEKYPIMESDTTVLRNNVICKADAAIKSEYTKFWNIMLSIGAAEDLLKSDVLEHIIFLKKTLKFKYGRIWSLFCKETYVDINASGSFNFSKLEQILDFMINNQIIPFLDLGFKPKILNRKVGDAILNEGRNSAFSSQYQYGKLIREFIKHCIQRYGIEQVETWKFEIWWDQSTPLEGKGLTWFSTFETAYQRIKAYIPRAMVGGCGFITYDENVTFENYLTRMVRQSIKPDFISAYIYPYSLLEEKERKSAISSDEHFVEKKIKELKRILRTYDLSEELLYITEWNMSISSRNYLHDSCYKGAYVMKNLLDCIGLINIMAYWGSTDLVYEYFDSMRFLNGSPGLLNKHGVRKPAFYAFDFMNRLGKNLLVKGQNYIITSNNHNGYYIACHNYTKPGLEYYYKFQEEVSYQEVKNLFDQNELKLTFQIDNVRKGNYIVKKYYINEEAGSVLDEWMHIANVENMDQEDKEYLSSIAIPHRVSETCQDKKNTLIINTLMKTNEIQFFHINYIEE